MEALNRPKTVDLGKGSQWQKHGFGGTCHCHSQLPAVVHVMMNNEVMIVSQRVKSVISRLTLRSGTYSRKPSRYSGESVKLPTKGLGYACFPDCATTLCSVVSQTACSLATKVDIAEYINNLYVGTFPFSSYSTTTYLLHHVWKISSDTQKLTRSDSVANFHLKTGRQRIQDHIAVPFTPDLAISPKCSPPNRPHFSHFNASLYGCLAVVRSLRSVQLGQHPSLELIPARHFSIAG